ncbi:MAG TPA: CDP-glycerol glycerophosphotransferase family protein [Candidatus Limnocylindrales bacterium]|nr:CDP-glycerol glycerophosphotransferase family protein [Candidatus Limnocylindrales bacterium]
MSAVHNVEPYLEDYTRSLERLRVRSGDLEVIAVDDGSTDGSLDALRAWAGRSRHRVHVFTQPNAGQGPARNRGLEHATGEWVTFTDPDDMLDRDFLRVADRFAAAHPEIQVMAAKPIVFREDLGVVADTHPRRMQYRHGNRVVDLDASPQVFTGSSTLSFFRLDRLWERGIRFDPRVRPNFEDGHFAVHYLLTLDEPLVGILRDARYIYRRRAAGTSTSQLSLAHAGRFGDVLEHGYLEVMDAAGARFGHIPEWLQHVIVYELSWYLSADDKITSDIVLPEELQPRFHELLGRILRRLDPGVVHSHAVHRLRPVWADVLAHAYREEPWHSPFVVRGKVDRQMRLERVGYRFTGGLPRERIVVGGREVLPAWAKTRGQLYFGRTVLQDRILWIPVGSDLRFELDGVVMPTTLTWRPPRGAVPRRAWAERLPIYRRLPPAYVRARLTQRLLTVARRWTSRLAGLATKVPGYGTRFRNAWVVMDRVHNADDNGERLFEHLRAARRDINAWFVLAPGTPDWRRLRAAGTARLVAWGSFEWRVLLRSARWLVSSHADRGLVAPPEIVRREVDRPWKFAFLQHGVIKDDLSLWLNHRDIDMFVVSTQAELASVAGDGTGYTVTHKETRLTGLPRFDRLLAKGRAVSPDLRDLVIVAPTWRTRLTLPITGAGERRGVDDAYWRSDYHVAWMAILRSEAIAAACARHGRRLAFMPHPNLQPILASLDLPPHVQPMSFEGQDVQGLYARCALLVTDYSSVAFNIAYLDRPIVYFQFDRAEMERGGHMGRKGYFEYERDGYGPVAEDAATAEREIVAAIEAGPHAAPVYQARIDAAFPERDGGASARVVRAIEELSRPWKAPGS